MDNPYPKFRVWWIPQVPMKPFYWPVYNIAEGLRVCEMLAAYDSFQLENNIKPDYCNVGGIEYWDIEDQQWYTVDEHFIGG